VRASGTQRAAAFTNDRFGLRTGAAGSPRHRLDAVSLAVFTALEELAESGPDLYASCPARLKPRALNNKHAALNQIQELVYELST
jgi:hypothetical protein